MQCPIAVQGRECGADAQVQSARIARRDEAVAIHFDCSQGHRFHVNPRERWQTCLCDKQDHTAMLQPGHVLTLNGPLKTALRTLAAQKDIQVIVPE